MYSRDYPHMPWWRKLDILLRAVGYFVIYLGVQVAVSFGLVALRLWTESDLADSTILRVADVLDQGSLTFAIVLSPILTLLIFVMIWALRRISVIERLDLRPVSWRKLLGYTALGLALNTGITLLLTILPPEVSDSYRVASGPLFSDITVLSVVAIVILAPICEEVIFRGILHKALRTVMPVWGALLVSSAIFGTVHAGWVWMLLATGMGLILAYAYEKTQSLYVPIVMHMAINGFSVLLTVFFSNSI